MNLVTGATGIIGSHVVLHLLQKGESVVASRQKNSDISKVERLFSYYTSSHKELFDKIKWIEMDVRDIFSIEDGLEGISRVYHCAGIVSFDKRDRKKLKEINENGTRNMVNACLGRAGVDLCHVSSIATINNLDHKEMLDESVFWKTSGAESDYAISKYNAEREVWRGMEEGLNMVIVNPGVVLGPGFWTQSSGRIFERGFKGNPFYTRGNWAYVAASDTAKIMHSLMEKKLFGNRYVVIEGNYAIKDAFSYINSGFGKSAPMIRIGRMGMNLVRILEICLKPGSRKTRTITKALINAAFSKQVYSNKKVKEALQVNFRSTQELIGEVCEIYVREHKRR